MPSFIHKSVLIALILLPPGEIAEAMVVNHWPLFTGEREEREGPLVQWQSLGPLIFHGQKDGTSIQGFRPLWITLEETERGRAQFHFLYPFYNQKRTDHGFSWNVLTVTAYSRYQREGAGDETTLRIFPILFSRASPDPEREYFGLFPLAGDTRNFLGYDRFAWVFFPLLGRFERDDVVTRAMPWPFLRTVRGDQTEGFHLWPLYGRVTRENHSDRMYYLWPLGFQVRTGPEEAPSFHASGLLPFYSFSSSDRAFSRTIVWPFFGYTRSFDPEYAENRYFWPLLVQRRGESHINRWAPLYTRSERGGMEKTWVAWPVFRKTRWMDRGLEVERTQVLYFLYWNMNQSIPGEPAAGRAVKRHLWPLFSHWDNGAGKRQTQLFSPLEVFFPANEIVRHQYSPLFAVYRRETLEGESIRRSLLWNLVYWKTGKEETVFQVGPLFDFERDGEGRSFSLVKGLLEYSGQGDRRFPRFFWIRRGRENAATRQGTLP